MRFKTGTVEIAYNHRTGYGIRKPFMKAKVFFACAAAIILFSSVAASNYCLSELRKHVIRENERQLNIATGPLDSYFMRLKNSLNIFMMDTDTRLFFTLNDKYSSFTSSLPMIMSKIDTFQNLNFIFDGTYVYIEKIDTSVTSNGTYDLETLLQQKYSEDTRKILENTIQKKEYKFDLIPLQKNESKGELNGDSVKKPIIAALYSVKDGAGKNLGFILINIDPALLYNFKNSMGIPGDLAFGIIDRNFKVVSNANGDTPDGSNVKIDHFNGGNSLFYTADILGKSYYITLKKSQYMDWYYYVLTSKSVVDGKLLRNYIAAVAVILLLLLVSFLTLSYIQSVKYRPILELLDFCGIDTDGNGAALADYTVIKNRIRLLMEENKALRGTTIKDSDSGILKDVLYVRLMNGAIREEDYRKYISSYNIRLDYHNMFVLVLQYCDENYGRKICSDILEICREKSSLYTCVFCENSPERSIMIIDFTSKDGVSAFISEFNPLDCNREWIQIGVGEAVGNPLELKTSLVQARNALENRNIQDSRHIYRYEEGNRKSSIYYIPGDLQKKLSNHLLLGDCKQVNELIDQVYDRNGAIGYSSYIQMNIEMVNILGRILQDTGYDMEEILENTGKIAELHFFGIARQRKDVKDMYNRACEHYKENKNENHIKEYMLNFIEKNYDKEISLDIIADGLGVTANYLTRCFKKFTGMNYIDYINDLRIKKAVQLILTTDMKIKDVCKSVGYQSENSFIRMFKKLEGITPSEYKRFGRETGR